MSARWVLPLVGMLLAAPGNAGAAPSYTITALGTLGGSRAYAYAINASGVVAGYANTAGDAAEYGFVWDPVAGMRALPTLGGVYSIARGINDAGQVVGWSERDAISMVIGAFLWDAASGMRDLGGSDPDWSSLGYAINDAGLVTGTALFSGFHLHAFLWSDAGGMQDIGSLGEGDAGGRAINASGQVAGTAWVWDQDYPGAEHAFLWDAVGGMRDLGTLGGTQSGANGINAAGQVTGFAGTADGATHAFLWDAAGGMRDLGTLGGTRSWGLGINAAGQVVGYSTGQGDRDSRAFLWDGIAMHDLNDLVPTRGDLVLRSATAINDVGQIVVAGRVGGYEQVFVLTPTGLDAVSEPATPGLFGAALLALGLARRGRRGARPG